eukprot:m.167744 g.167744  ORF g.167744 m.167744 type:complete len:51 (-) comp14467_c0_seq3:86-238(-)
MAYDGALKGCDTVTLAVTHYCDDHTYDKNSTQCRCTYVLRVIPLAVPYDR